MVYFNAINYICFNLLISLVKLHNSPKSFPNLIDPDLLRTCRIGLKQSSKLLIIIK